MRICSSYTIWLIFSVPSAPRDIRCDILKDESITLKWLEPHNPNGDLVRYYIDVFYASDIYSFTTNTAGVVESHQVAKLSPGKITRNKGYFCCCSILTFL